MTTKYLGKVTSESEQRQFGCIILSTNERITWSRWVNAFGRVQPQDIGKKVFDVDGVLQMESQGQKAEREALEAQSAKRWRRSATLTRILTQPLSVC